jgi:hypothetical protein
MKDIISMLNSQLKEYINKVKELEKRLQLAEECIYTAKKECFLQCEAAYSELNKYTNKYGNNK